MDCCQITLGIVEDWLRAESAAADESSDDVIRHFASSLVKHYDLAARRNLQTVHVSSDFDLYTTTYVLSAHVPPCALPVACLRSLTRAVYNGATSDWKVGATTARIAICK
jgi:hypothetical protein